jgi:hypothetical protein
MGNVPDKNKLVVSPSIKKKESNNGKVSKTTRKRSIDSSLS